MPESEYWITGFLLLLMFSGMPVAFAMLVAGALGIYVTIGWGPMIGVLTATPYDHIAGYTLSTLPMFVLLGQLLTHSRVSRDLFDSAHSWLGHMRGGLAYASVIGGALLAAISGSTAAAAATLAGAAYPDMKRFGYADSFSAGILAVVGTLAIMIPPSLGFVVYGIYTDTPINRLFMAGVLPGLMTAVGYAIVIFFMLRQNPRLAPVVETRPPLKQRVTSLRLVWPVLLLMAGILGGIYSGVMTPTEAGALGALGAFVIGVAMRRLGLQELNAAFDAAIRSSGSILAIIAFSGVFAVFLSLSGVAQSLLSAVSYSGLPNWSILLAVLAMLFVLGCFIDQLSVLILTLPLVFPLLTGLGYDPVWIGVIYVKTAEIGFMTPPLGINAFIVSRTTGVPLPSVFRGIWPFVLFEIFLLIVLIVFPEITLWLPERM